MKTSLIFKTALLAGSAISFGYSYFDHSKNDKQELQTHITQDSTALATIEQKINFKYDSIQTIYNNNYDKSNVRILPQLLMNDQLNATHALQQKTAPLKQLVEQNKSQIQALNTMDDRTNFISRSISGAMLGAFLVMGAMTLMKKRIESEKKLDLQ